MEEKSFKTATIKERKIKGRVEIDIQKCKGCELCISACKEKVLSLSGSINLKGYRYIIADNNTCTGCVNCALVCPDAVITVFRTHKKKIPVEISQTEIREQLREMLDSEK